ncbi:MAG: hypothetical protein A2Y62_17065 [Candidatus Fischerbacteria bacterium RBG_13_37_8]|uniref:PTS EIIA type-4 domain-containing protein n=1 Tax=Candidatus Fischerbacteria bacterium RBG_13_37_8 TaxID=1817863 RepID=A0A1F5VFX7_9BACT|nr:MAG: hypothetical protein A2Y62_17065 [Candidatus Fischerbacteria bacterium RBG_13_37_8]
MIGILLVTHGNLGNELLETARTIVGEELENARALSVGWNNHMTDINNKISALLKDLDRGDGVLVLTDMFGGTPSNVSFSFVGERKIEVLTGVNLPMIIKLYNHRGQISLESLAKMIVEQGRKSISLGSEFVSAQKNK